jgi:hypothetical protein
MDCGWLLRVSGVGLLIVLLLASPSCGHDQQLVSISVLPQGATLTLTGPGQSLSIQFTAIGSYIHPPESKDITSRVVWSSDSPQVIDFNTPGSSGLATTTGTACGTNIGILAKVYSRPSNPPSGSVVVGTSTVNVTITGC